LWFADLQHELLTLFPLLDASKVGEVPASLAPVIEEDERLVKVVAFGLPQIFGDRLLRDVSGLIEERDIPLLRLAQVVAQGVDDRLARGPPFLSVFSLIATPLSVANYLDR
jgi:hypothetical protein